MTKPASAGRRFLMSEYPVNAKLIIMKIAPESITDVHGIMEACDYLAIVRTLEPETAIVEIIATPDTFAESYEIARVMERRLGAEILHPAYSGGNYAVAGADNHPITT